MIPIDEALADSKRILQSLRDSGLSEKSGAVKDAVRQLKRLEELKQNPFPHSIRCQRPEMREYRGRTWDSCKIIDANGAEHEGYLDTSWGHFFYFETSDGWRKASVDQFIESVGCTNVADFRKALEHFHKADKSISFQIKLSPLSASNAP